jgi:hypothetical protein
MNAAISPLSGTQVAMQRRGALMRFGTKLALAAVLSIGLGLMIFTKIIPVSIALSPCNKMQRARQLSPDGKHEATITYQFCSAFVGATAESFWVTVYDTANAGDDGVEVFIALDRAPELSWISSTGLLITILQVCEVHKSLHHAGPIEVTYRLADDLLEKNFEKRMLDFERRARDAAEKGLTSDARNPGALKRSIEFAWMRYRKLKEWAAENAINGSM